ncbi:RNA-dependent RNA polymerase [Ceratobasidium mitovirus A]|uniref:RNA-dependent RNA polymerase n=1 Tax=Ceratobasidium mitovirus A TaxID=1964428 RepID=A0ABM6ENP8_9VIRU|nr:RNA-dependent RNA polymerase [Ceratobasidium mitovirus A]AOX47577.1 RNA-dependent RNA polymerase [Ceratobasidium mitovirus A]
MKTLFASYNTYKNITPIFVAGGLNARLQTTVSNTMKLNTLTIKDMRIPKLNVGRNQKRFVNTSKAILAYIMTQTLLLESQKAVLARLIAVMENLYLNDPLAYVQKSKLLSNWFKVNLGAKVRSQGNITVGSWYRYEHSPGELLDCMQMLETITDKGLREAFIRVVLSILELYNVLLVPKDTSLSTITQLMTDGSRWDGVINIPVAIGNLGLDPEVFDREFRAEQAAHNSHFSSSSGPNGHSLWMAHLDAQAIVADSAFAEIMRTFAGLTQRVYLWNSLLGAANNPRFFKQDMGPLTHSKLHYILEKGDKVRTVAILDWWTQDLLCPLHNAVANFLKRLPTDGTFDQDKVALKVKEMTANPSIEVFSLDLTAATDRLPVRLQALILDSLINIKGFGDAWRALLTERDFMLPDGRLVRYAVGQPMGAKSSFPMLALTHHLIVMEAASRALVTNFSDYVVLGDDIVIGNRSVAEKYRIIMSELGMELSLNKSIWIEPGNRLFSVAEICKRLFLDGAEVSSLPVRLMANVIEHNHMIYQLQDEMFKRSQVNVPDQFKFFLAALIHNRQGLEMIAGLNILSPLLTGMKSNVQILSVPELKGDLWQTLFSVDLFVLIQVFMFTVCQEQLKRLGIMVKDSSSTFDIMSRAGKLFNATGIGYYLDRSDDHKELEYKPFVNFTPDDISDWAISGTDHPAHEVIKADIQRVNLLLMELSIASSQDLITKLMHSIVDSLKLAALDFNVDRRLGNANVGRRVLELTARNIDSLKLRDNGTITFSMKLDPFNIIWNLKLVKGQNLSIYRSASKVSTTLKDAQAKFNSLLK